MNLIFFSHNVQNLMDIAQIEDNVEKTSLNF